MKKLFLLLFTGTLFSFTTHKYYIALTEIEFNENNQSVEIIMNVFMDDIEFAINKEYNTDLQLTTEKEPENVNTYFEKYLNKHFKIYLNNIDYSYTFIGKEYDGNIVYFYLEIEKINKVENLTIQNTVLINHFHNQKNLIKAKINGERKSLFLTKKNDKGLLNF